MTHRINTPNLCALALMLCVGCHRDERASTANHSGGHDDLFASPRILALAVEITPHQLEALKHKKDSHDYVIGTVHEGDRSWKNVGLHCRGNPAKELATGKPDLIVTFDKFISGQRFRGQRRLILQSSRNDPSYLAAPIALETFEAAGVPAPRSGFARVQLNGRDLGLYVFIEGVEREFLERHFSNPGGNLYDEGHPLDVTGRLEKARGRDRHDQSDVDALAAAALQANPAERWRQLQQRLDIDRFLKFTALEVLWWQDDSYSLEARKFRLYHDPTSDLMVFFPKEVGRVLKRSDGPLLAECRGVVASAVLNTPEGRQRFRETLAGLLNGVFTPDKVRARAQELGAAIRPALSGDGADAVQAFDKAVTQFLEAVTQRANFAAEQLRAASTQ